MLPLPGWVRAEWQSLSGISLFLRPEFDAAYARVFSRLGVGPTPLGVMGRKSLLVRDVLDSLGIENGPLMRAVRDCNGCGECLTGCPDERKQSMDRTYLLDALVDGADIYTCCHVDRVVMSSNRALGVTGHVSDPMSGDKLGKFTVRAPRVVLSAGAAHTPVILLQSGIKAQGTVGGSLYAHIGGAVVGVMDQLVEPWRGATQGWGALSSEIRGLKYESLWAPPSMLLVKWGGVGRQWFEDVQDVRNAVIISCIYKADVRGSVAVKHSGMPDMRLWISDGDAHTVNRGLRTAALGLLDIGARYVMSGVPGAVTKMRSKADADSLLDTSLRAEGLQNTLTHIFGSCPMHTQAGKGTVDESGKVHGTEGLYICDGSIFPEASAVNPQATIMALCDVISRRLACLPLDETPAGG